MPYSVNLNRYTFLINQQTQLIIELFKTACDQVFKKESGEDKLTTDLLISNAELRRGFIPKLLNKLENINEKKYGAGFATLSQIDHLKLDPRADKMVDAFTNELNQLFTKNNLKSYDMSREEYIDSPALVFRVLLLRLVTIALCDDNTYVRDGELLLKVYSNFVDLVLSNLDQFGGEKDIFRYFASKEHLDWMNDIRHIIQAVKLIHSHQDSLTECLTTLKSITYTIQRLILARLLIADSQCKWPAFTNFRAPYISSDDFKDQFIDDTLNRYENYLAGKNTFKNVKDINAFTQPIDIMTFAAVEHLGRQQKRKAILDVKDICDTPPIAALIACKNNQCPEDTYKKLEALYDLYFKSRCLLISLEQVDELITSCSWVPLVMGAINLKPISDLIRIHCDACTNLLSIANNDLIAKLEHAQIIMHQSFHAQAQLTQMQKRIKALEELQDAVKIQKIKYQIAHNINNLIEIQNALEISLLRYFSRSEKAVQNKPAIASSVVVNNFLDTARLPQIEAKPTPAITMVKPQPVPSYATSNAAFFTPENNHLKKQFEQEYRRYKHQF